MNKMDRHSQEDREFVIIGDLHLVDLEARKKGYRPYKDPLFSIDRPFSDFLKWIDSASTGPLTLIINGDFIDFDLIFLGDGIDSETAMVKLERIIFDHFLIFESLVRFIAREKNRTIFVLGNHDLEFLQKDLIDHLFTRLERLSREMRLSDLDMPKLRTRFTIEPLFYYEKDLFYVEHGDRFDKYGISPRPITLDSFYGPARTFLSLGSISNRYILKELPTFNPFMSEEVIKGLGGYLGHLIRHYPFPPYRLPLRYLKGALQAFLVALRERKRYLANPLTIQKEEVIKVSRKMNMDEDVVKRLIAMGKESVITKSPITVFRTLWLDRVSIFFFFSLIISFLLITRRPLWHIPTLISFMAFFYLLYEYKMGEKDVLREKGGLGRYARDLFRIIKTPIVILGHSHHPEDLHIEGGGRYLNCGSWAQILEGRGCCSKPWSKGRTFVHIRIHGDLIKADLMQWRNEGPVKLSC